MNSNKKLLQGILLEPSTFCETKNITERKKAEEKIGSYTKEYLLEVISVFQPYSSTPLTLDDAREIMDNLINLFLTLADTENINNNKITDKSA